MAKENKKVNNVIIICSSKGGEVSNEVLNWAVKF